MFIDYARIQVKAGQGGSGCVSFRREKFVPHGGPDGGDGGAGASVIFVADRNLHTLIDFKYKRVYKAGRGTHGKGSDKHGKKAKDLTIRVPIGTTVKDQDRGEIIFDFVSNGEMTVIAQGGRGGRGNARFTTSTNQAPREWEVGLPGEEKNLELELKLIADIGLVGLPNAGKSTLLSRISAARPKIADYPFTTLQPNLGIVRYKDFESFVVADIPGLIEGSHTGKGLGHRFLRHIERTRALVFMVEYTEEDPESTYLMLKRELQAFSRVLVNKPQLLLLTKSDLKSQHINQKKIRQNISVYPMSSVTGENLETVKDAFFQLIQKAREQENIA